MGYNNDCVLAGVEFGGDTNKNTAHIIQMRTVLKVILLQTEIFFTLHNQFVIYGQICVFINIAVYIFMFFGSICHYLKASRLFSGIFRLLLKKQLSQP